MTDTGCTCGFAETGTETLTDHLLEVFIPADAADTDGRVHEEGSPALTCQCGLATTSPEELDAHFLRLFTPPDLIARDGRRHQRTA
jgi:hypothetical protein